MSLLLPETEAPKGSESMSIPVPDGAEVPEGGDVKGIAAADGRVAGPRFLEKLGDETGFLPVELPRKTCSLPAETLLRKLGRLATSKEPWLPVGSIGPLLVVGHYKAGEEELWGVPEALTVKILITEEIYKAVHKDLGERLRYKPIPAKNPLEGTLPDPPKNTDFKQVLDWFIANYPQEDEEREKFRKLLQENSSKPMQTVENLSFLPRHYGVAVYHWLTGKQIFNPEDAPGQTVFPDTLLEKHGVYPLFCGRDKIYLLSDKASNYAFEDEWHSLGNEGAAMVGVMCDSTAIGKAISRNRSRSSMDGGAGAAVGELYYSDDAGLVEIDPVEMGRLNPANPNNTPEQIVHWVLNRSLTLRASDLHIERYFNTVRFRARIDGQMHVIHSASEEELPRYIAMLKNYSNLAQERQRLQDGRFAMKLGQRRVDVRVAAIPCRRSMQKIVMRFLDKQDGVKQLSELNLSERQAKITKETMDRDQGLVLVTGPTGSGKTTTLYAFLNSINEVGINIHTIEDPIEYEIEGINQTQTDPFSGIDFAAGLRSLLRADPDVMLIGESRDAETAMAAINAALTGHLVLTTLHANDSLRAVSRLLSMGIEPYLLSDSLAMSQAQRLVRRLCTYCKRPTPMTRQMQEYLYRQGILKAPTTDPIFESAGCDECHGTGYHGRIALMEMCPITMELADLVARGAPISEMRKVAQANGVLSLYQEGLRQIVDGHTTYSEIKKLSYTSEG